MRADGTGRSNALPVLQLVLGGALMVLGALVVLVRGELWALVLELFGATQVLAGLQTHRSNQRLDREEDARLDAPAGAEPPSGSQ